MTTTAAVNEGVASQEDEQDDSTPSNTPFHVLGIALVVDEIGKGARLAFRYPVAPTLPKMDDLFFTLPPRVMAKLFRPKKPLCGQPMTISVGGTVFLCRAVLLENEESQLSLFNVIVALAPSVPTSLPIAGWFDRDSEQASVPSSSFLCVRRVHVSIARLCRVVEREETKCAYVSVQATHLLKLQADARQAMDKQRKATSDTTADAPTSEAPSRTRGGHRRVLSASNTVASLAAAAGQAESTGEAHSQSQDDTHYEMDQEVLEIVLSAPSPSSHEGNLAHELVQVYHALARNDAEFLPTPSILLSGSHGIVHVNGHMAVFIEAVASKSSCASVRSYHTLLFPHASPKELVQPHQQERLDQLLLTVNPQKSLLEIANKAALPLPIVLELATHLIKKGTCVVSSPIAHSTRLACTSQAITKMQQESLHFSQVFNLSIFVVTSVLTSQGLSLGEIMSAAAGTGVYSEAKMLGRMIQNDQQQAVEDTIHAMAVWLHSHDVVVGMEEYIIAVGIEVDDKDLDDSNATNDNAVEDESPESLLYTELQEFLTGNISTVALCWRFGIESLRMHRLKSWGVANGKLRVVMRVPSPKDDWYTSESE